jgi:hypothetical protein
MKRYRRDCPFPGCGTIALVKLSNHLSQVHGLSSEERKPYLQKAKLQKYKISKTLRKRWIPFSDEINPM